MSEKLKLNLDEYGRVIIDDEELLCEIYGSLAIFNHTMEHHDANCSNEFCGHVIACVNTSCADKK